MANQDPGRTPPRESADCGNTAGDGPRLIYPIEEGFGGRHMRVEARRALGQVREYARETLRRDRLVLRASKAAIKCHIDAAIDRLGAAAPLSIDMDDYGFRNGCQTIVRYALERKRRRALGLTWAGIKCVSLFLAEVGPFGARLSHAFEQCY